MAAAESAAELAAAASPTPAAPAASGQLSEAQFSAAVRLFCQWWQQAFPDQARWVAQSVVLPVTEQVVEYAQLERAVVVLASEPKVSSPPTAAQPEQPQEQQGEQQATGNNVGACSSSLEGWDEATAQCSDAACQGGSSRHHSPPPPPQQQQQQLVRQLHRYSIVWHGIYRVPVLYLEGCLEDGQPLSLTSLCQGLPHLAEHCCQQDGATEQQQQASSSWTYVTATAHPATGAQPCFMLHPCQTAVRMQLLLEQQQHLHQTCAADDASGGGGGGDEVAAAQLLLYLQAWCSMVAAPLLALDMLLLPPVTG